MGAVSFSSTTLPIWTMGPAAALALATLGGAAAGSGGVAGVTSATVAFTVADGVSGDWTAVLSANLAGARVDPVGALECNLGVGPSARCSKRRALVEFAISDLATAGSSNSDGGGSLCGPAGLWATWICPSGGDWAGALSGTGVFLALAVSCGADAGKG